MGMMVTVFKTAGGANKLIATDNPVVSTTLYKDLNVQSQCCRYGPRHFPTVRIRERQNQAQAKL